MLSLWFIHPFSRQLTFPPQNFILLSMKLIKVESMFLHSGQARFSLYAANAFLINFSFYFCFLIWHSLLNDLTGWDTCGETYGKRRQHIHNNATKSHILVHHAYNKIRDSQKVRLFHAVKLTWNLWHIACFNKRHDAGCLTDRSIRWHEKKTYKNCHLSGPSARGVGIWQLNLQQMGAAAPPLLSATPAYERDPVHLLGRAWMRWITQRQRAE